MRYLVLSFLLLASASLSAETKKNSRKKDDWASDRHIATFIPFAGIVSYGNFNPGAGVDYEYMISREHGIGVHIPLMIGYAGPEQGDLYYGDYKHSVVYTAPGIRFHTGNSKSDVDFITGPSVLIGNLHFKPVEDFYNPGSVPSPYNYSMVGLVADNTLNFYRRHFVFGFDVRVGTLIEKQQDTRFFIHFGMHFGGKF